MTMHLVPTLRNVASWPRSLRKAAEGITAMLMHAFMLARARAAESPSPLVRSIAERDGQAWDMELRDRETAVLRRRIEAMPPLKRPHVLPQDRFEILQIMRLRGWSVEETAERFVLHPNTILDWTKRFRDSKDPNGFFGRPAFNRMHDAARWVAHEIRALCPEKEFGTRSIAMALVRGGIKLGRSSVQRILREKKPDQPKPDTVSAVKETESPSPRAPKHILRPKKPNRTWHLDLTTVEFFWVRLYVAAVVDGFSRKILALKVYAKTPCARNMVALVRTCMDRFGVPRFMVTDHGTQFRRRFRDALGKRGVAVVRGRLIRSCEFNGKVERFFKTFKLWQRLTLWAWKPAWIQRRLDAFREWYNTKRPMWTLSGRTPQEVWEGTQLPEAVAYSVDDSFEPVFEIARRRMYGDRRLLFVDIGVHHRLKRSG